MEIADADHGDGWLLDLVAGENRFQFVDGYSIHVYVYTADGCDGEPKETAEAIPMWTPIDSIPYHEMWEDDQLWVPLLLAGTSFSGRFIFEGDRMLDHHIALAEASTWRDSGALGPAPAQNLTL